MWKMRQCLKKYPTVAGFEKNGWGVWIKELHLSEDEKGKESLPESPEQTHPLQDHIAHQCDLCETTDPLEIWDNKMRLLKHIVLISQKHWKLTQLNFIGIICFVLIKYVTVCSINLKKKCFSLFLIGLGVLRKQHID